MKKLILIFAGLIVIFSSCKKNYNYDEILPSNKNMTSLVVNDSFDWKSSMDVEVLLTGSADGVISINSTEGANYNRGMLHFGTEYKTKITLPTYVTEVQIVYMGKTELFQIINNKIELTL